MVIFSIREFYFLLELKERCFLGRFLPIHITWGTQSFEPFRYSGAWDSQDEEAGWNS